MGEQMLKPCPFCGSRACREEDNAIRCTHCDAWLSAYNATEQWNRRASPEAGGNVPEDVRLFAEHQAAHCDAKHADEPCPSDLCSVARFILSLPQTASPAPNPGQTHWEGCWRDPKHHACAVAEVERLAAEFKDIAEHGLRFDLQPTHKFDGTMETAEMFWHEYARRMDDSIRARARNAIPSEDDHG